MYDKIYSRPRIKIPKININSRRNRIDDKKQKKIIQIITIVIVAFSTVKIILNSVEPIFDTLCENRAKAIATLVSNEQATNVMKEHSYDEMFKIEKDANNNITMISSNIIAINEIISDIAIKIQQDLDTKGKEDISIALRKFYRI